MTERDSQGVVFTRESNYYIVGTNQRNDNNAESNLSSVVLPSEFNGAPVKAIGDFAFRKSTTLVSVFIPNTVEELRIDCFSYAKTLKTVLFADNSKLRKIELGAFYCTDIKHIVVPPSVKTFGGNCFACTRLESIFVCGIPSSIHSYIFGTNDPGNFLAFPAQVYVNERFPFDKFGDFENITRSSSCNLNINTRCINRRHSSTRTITKLTIILILHTT